MDPLLDNGLFARILRVSLIATVYYFSAELGLSLAFKNVSVSPVWPPTGIAISSVLLFGWGALPGIFLGAFFSNYFLTPVGPWISLGIAFGNSLEAWAAFKLLKRFSPDLESFNRAQTLKHFLLYGCALSSAVAATIGTLVLLAGGRLELHGFSTLWITWWIGDVSGAVFIVPFVLGLRSLASKKIVPLRLLEGILLVLGMIVTTDISFGHSPYLAQIRTHLPAGFLNIPIYLWGVFRFGQTLLPALLLAQATVAVFSTVNGYGPFFRENQNDSLIILQLFLFSRAITFQILATIIAELRGFQFISDKAAESHILTDTNGRILYANDIVCKRLGYSKSELTEIYLSQFSPSFDNHLIQDVLSKKEEPRFTTLEVTHIRKDGSTFPAEVSVTPMLFGEKLQLFYVSRDISVRKQQENLLKRSEARLRQISETIREAFYLIKLPERRVEYMSPAFEIIWKRNIEELDRYPDSTLDSIHPEDKERVQRFFETEVKDSESAIEYRINLPQGGIKWISERIFPIRDQNGQPYQLTGVIEDITLRKEIDEKLRLKADDLARTNTDLESFSAMVSHDLKSPLNTVSNFAQLLAKLNQNSLDPDSREYLNYIIEGCRKMRRLIDDLLKSAHLGKNLGESQLLDLNSILAETLKSLASQIKESKAEIVADFLPTIYGNATDLGLIFQNLIGNAIKYRRDTFPIVHIRSVRKANEWVFSVEDNGIGFPMEDQEKIFNFFVRLHPQEEYEGTGLGLAMCKKSVLVMGGKIWCESIEGVGSKFYFSIPDKKVETSTDPWRVTEKIPSRSAAALSFDRSRNLEILIVDDSPADANIIEVLLKRERLGYKIQMVRDGEKALEFLQQRIPNNLPSLILLDLNIPKIEGLDVLKEIKNHPELRQIPVIIMSSSKKDEDTRKAYELSAACFVAKPLDLNGYKKMLGTLQEFWFGLAILPKVENAPFSNSKT